MNDRGNQKHAREISQYRKNLSEHPECRIFTEQSKFVDNRGIHPTNHNHNEDKHPRQLPIFLKNMPDHFSPACSNRAVTRRSRQSRENGPKGHRVRINITDAFHSRADPFVQAVFVEPCVNKSQHVTHRANLHPFLWSWIRLSRFSLERHTHFSKAPYNVAHGFLEKQLALVEKCHVRCNTVNFSELVR